MPPREGGGGPIPAPHPAGAGPFKTPPLPAASSPPGKCQLTARGACRERRAALHIPACRAAGRGCRFPRQPPASAQRGGRGGLPILSPYWLSVGLNALPIGRDSGGGGSGVPGGDWLRAGPVGGCVMTPPADPRREPAAAVRCGGGSGGAGLGRGVPVPGWAAPRRWVRRHRGERCTEPGRDRLSVPRSVP